MIDQFLNRKYNIESYNCFHFAAEVWLFLTGVDILDSFSSIAKGSLENRKVCKSAIAGVNKIAKLESPCIVTLSRKHGAPHVGVGIDEKVLHITKQGVHYVDLDIARIGFNKIRFYK